MDNSEISNSMQSIWQHYIFVKWMGRKGLWCTYCSTVRIPVLSVSFSRWSGKIGIRCISTNHIHVIWL